MVILSALDSSQPHYISGQGCCHGSEASQGTAAQPAWGWCPSQPGRFGRAYPCNSSSSWSRFRIPQNTRIQSCLACWRRCHCRRGLERSCTRRCLLPVLKRKENTERDKRVLEALRGCGSETWETRTERRKKCSEEIGWSGKLSPS